MTTSAEAAGRKGAAEIGTALPPLDSSLTTPTPHAPLIQGVEKVVLLRRERRQLDVCNAKQVDFAHFYNQLRGDLRAGK